MRRIMIYVLTLAAMAWFSADASAQRWRSRGWVYSYPTYYYTSPTYSYVTPSSYYYTTTPSYYYDGGYYYSTYPSYSSYYYTPSYYYSSYPGYYRGGVWYGGPRWGIGVRW